MRDANELVVENSIISPAISLSALLRRRWASSRTPRSARPKKPLSVERLWVSPLNSMLILARSSEYSVPSAASSRLSSAMAGSKVPRKQSQRANACSPSLSSRSARCALEDTLEEVEVGLEYDQAQIIEEDLLRLGVCIGGGLLEVHHRQRLVALKKGLLGVPLGNDLKPVHRHPRLSPMRRAAQQNFS